MGTWFSVLVSMSGMLNKRGIVQWLAGILSAKISAPGLSGFPAFFFLLVIYVFAHYLFASQVAHVGALYQPFCSLMVRAGTPPTVALMSLAIASNSFSALTPYASVQAPVYFGARYVTQSEWYRMGIIFVALSMLIWLTVGAMWWRVLGVV